ncbi:F-box/kelch-repeat protein At1g15670-like [Cryptomeria japonica]|uniref:F-box/kelch-repeat protein At1g15670-like n=1 Tax=Cryptomeria japonica TaxID=3369 RepID=UPI0027DA8A6D|nr:F-box/kelch-repeat protein At1g15670-like [Cryptomeria japonica]
MDFLEELPEQIFRDILLRVPYKSQQQIKQLLEPAKETMECVQFYQDRIKFGLAEKYICFLEHGAISIYDPVHQSCIMRPHIPTGFHTLSDSHILCVKNKLILVGLTSESKYSMETLIYDVLSGTWKQAAQIPIGKRRFACCATPEGSIYIAGGYAKCDNAGEPREAAVYKVDEDKWELLPQMLEEVGFCRGFFFEGMFYVIGSVCQRFDPCTGV